MPTNALGADESLLALYCEQTGATPAEAEAAFGVMRDAVSGMHNCLIMAQTHLSLARKDLHDAECAKFGIDADCRPQGRRNNAPHETFHDYTSKEGRERRAAYSEARRRFTTSLSESRRSFEKATWFSSVAANERVLAAQTIEDREESVDPREEEMHAAIEDFVTPSDRKKAHKRAMKERKAGLDDWEDLAVKGREVFGT